MCSEELRVQMHDGHYRLLGSQRGIIKDANRFLCALEVRGLSPRTIRAYAYDLLTLYRWLKRTGKTLRRLQPADLLTFVDVQRKAGAHPSSINRRLTTCRFLYRFCTDQELDAGHRTGMSLPHYKSARRDHELGLHKLKKPGRRKLRLNTPRKLVEPLTSTQVRLFLRSLRRYRDIAIVHLMLLCGLRSREVLSLELGDISFAESRVRVHGKGDKERMLPLPDILEHSLRDYLRLERPSQCETPTLFVVLQGKRRGQPMTTSGLRSLFRHRRMNLEIATANPHRFRHTFGADMARAGVRLPILQKMMGHAHSRTTLQYINLSLEDIATEYQRAVTEIQKRYERE
jgi:site-specific recombinase XerD